MGFSGLFIKRPVMTTIVMAGILIFGLMAYRLLRVNDLPNVDFPTISVSAGLPGASPQTMASSVANPIEKEFATIAGVDSMSSSSSLGSTQITLQFALDRDIDAAAQDVQAAIARVTRHLPQSMPYPPSYQKVNPADQPVLYLVLTSKTLPLYALDEYAETTVALRLSTVSGVAAVQVYGGQKYAVRIQLDPRALVHRGIGIEDVADAVDQANVNLPTGVLYGQEKAYTVQADGQLTAAEAYRPIIVAYVDGKPVRLDALGRVIDGVENPRVAAWFNGTERSIMLAVQRQPGANTVEVTDRVKAAVATLQKTLPGSVSLYVLFDRSQSIRESVSDVRFTLLVTLALVVLVIFLFLRNLSATAIPSLAMPMSIVGTFAVMYLLDYSLDNLSLMALTLSVGFVVDDAIVMLENIVRHMEMGKQPLQAALDGAREIGFTIVSMTLSLAAVFIPVLFMGGIVGRLFREFAVVIGLSVLISGFVSLTLTPMLSSRFLKPPSEAHHRRLYGLSERFFTAMLRGYQVGLRWSLGHRRTMMAVTAGVTALTALLFIVIPKGFIPSQDIGMLFGQTEAAQGMAFDAMVKHQKAIAEVIKADPDVEVFTSSAGGRGGSLNTGSVWLRLKPRGQRKATADEIVDRLRPKIAAIPGVKAYIQSPPAIQVGGRQSRSQYQLTLQGPDTDELYRAAPLLEERMRALPGLTDVSTDLYLKNPEINIKMDRDKAASLGITPSQIETALYTAYGQRQISSIYAPNNEYQVLMELIPEHQDEPADLGLLYVRGKGGQLAPLSTMARVVTGVGPLTVNHSGQAPSVTLSFNIKPGVALGQAVDDVERLARATLPASIGTSFQGTAQAFQDSLRGLGFLLALAILVIYMVLGILYESFIHPITILSALPLAGAGAIATLLLFGSDLNIYAYVGIIMLVGLVKKNGIMMIDFALEAQRTEGKTAKEAIFQACVVRFRPIMMTTMAALFGTLPIALGFGAGGEARRPLGLAVVGGLVVSQSLTLFITPVFFTYMDGLQRRLGRRKARASETPPARAAETAAA